MPLRLPQIAILILLGCCITGCDVPRDPEGTLQKVRGGVLLVGVTESPPWVRRTPEGAEGVEADLVREFAEQLEAEVQWCWGESEGNLAALERYQLDLVIGNLTKSSPWSKRVAFSMPYYNETLSIGFADDEPTAITGRRVCVKQGSVLGALLKEQDAVPQGVTDLWRCEPPIAAGDWELEAHGLHPLGPPLQHRKHVIAAHPGENAFVVQLSRFLAGRQLEIRQQLLRSAKPPTQSPQP